MREQEKLNLDNHGEQVRVMKKGLEVRYFSVFEYASLELGVSSYCTLSIQ